MRRVERDNVRSKEKGLHRWNIWESEHMSPAPQQTFMAGGHEFFALQRAIG